jgi:hypothetical protein
MFLGPILTPTAALDYRLSWDLTHPRAGIATRNRTLHLAGLSGRDQGKNSQREQNELSHVVFLSTNLR